MCTRIRVPYNELLYCTRHTRHEARGETRQQRYSILRYAYGTSRAEYTERAEYISIQRHRDSLKVRTFVRERCA